MLRRLSKWLKLSHHRHSWQHRPHEHTSYLPLGALLAVLGVAIGAFTASAATPYAGPETGSIGMTGTMPGKPPTASAVIQAPTNNQRFATTPITVSGTCPASTLVEVFKNDIFAGSTTCSSEEQFSLQIDLLIGQNILIARVYDALNQAGPDSNAITVFYDALPAQTGPLRGLTFGGPQLLLNTDAVFRGSFPEQEMTMPLDVIGGTPPYAINIQWGDASNKIVPRGDNALFKVSHVYRRPGVYQITIQASDAGGRVAFLTVAAIINGQPGTVAAIAPSYKATSELLLLWPVYAAIIAVVASFWIGEQREKYILEKRGLLLHT